MCPFIMTLHFNLLPPVERAVLAARVGAGHRLWDVGSLLVPGVYTRAFLGSDSLCQESHREPLCIPANPNINPFPPGHDRPGLLEMTLQEDGMGDQAHHFCFLSF